MAEKASVLAAIFTARFLQRCADHVATWVAMQTEEAL
jgi:hypothetical protein